MGLTQTISSALTGLQAMQQGLALVADNVANANTPGYIRKSLLLTNSSEGGTGVQVVGISRELDQFVQRQLRTEVAGANYASTINQYYSRLDQVFGKPGGNDALDTLFNNFTSSLNALTASPDSIAAQGSVLNQAQVLAQHLNAMSGDIQQIRSQAESGIADGVNRANQLLQDIAQVSTRITATDGADAAAAALLDQRDKDITELSGLIDIRVLSTDHNGISIFTNSGVSLYDGQAVTLSFDGRPALNAQSAYNTDPNKSTVGTISLVTPNGDKVDLIGSKAIRSGTIAAYLQMRDQILPQAQRQLDEIANTLALSLSNRTQQGTAAVSGAQSGFDLDLSGLKTGNSISLVYTDNTTSTQHKVTIVRVDDPSTLPLDNSVTADPNDKVIGVDFSGGMASVVTQLNTALGSANLTFSNPSGSTLRVLDDGAPNLSDVNSFSASVTTSTLNSGDPTLPFFVDGFGGSLYTGAITAGGEQKTGFSASITVNPALLANPSALVRYSSTTNSGDSTRPDFIYKQLTAAAQLFSPTSGIGTASGPFSGTLADYVQQTISQQGAAADNASKLNDGQQIVVNALQTRFNDASGVNIDKEMSNLLTLQNAYGANARVMTAVKQMFDLLLGIGTGAIG
jgi:flagellar hook-associated protein 1 FlgK